MHISIVPRLTAPRLAAAGVSLAFAEAVRGGPGRLRDRSDGSDRRDHRHHRPTRCRRQADHRAGARRVGDSSSWNGVIERLQALGYTVDAPPNPLNGVSSDSAYLSDFLSTISGPIILVGHSYGGFVITNAATGNPQVKALVYDDAFIPAAGDTPQSLSSEAGIVPHLGGAELRALPRRPLRRRGLYVKQSVFPGCFANGLPASEGAALAAEQQPPVASILSDTLTTTPAWQTIPSWDVIGTPTT